MRHQYHSSFDRANRLANEQASDSVCVPVPSSQGACEFGVPDTFDALARFTLKERDHRSFYCCAFMILGHDVACFCTPRRFQPHPRPRAGKRHHSRLPTGPLTHCCVTEFMARSIYIPKMLDEGPSPTPLFSPCFSALTPPARGAQVKECYSHTANGGTQ